MGVISAGEQALELLDADAGVPKDGPERAAVELAVIRYDDLGERVKAAQDDGAAILGSGLRCCAIARSRPPTSSGVGAERWFAASGDR